VCFTRFTSKQASLRCQLLLRNEVYMREGRDSRWVGGLQACRVASQRPAYVHWRPSRAIVSTHEARANFNYCSCVIQAARHLRNVKSRSQEVKQPHTLLVAISRKAVPSAPTALPGWPPLPHLLHLPRQAAVLLLLLEPVGLCQLQPGHLLRAPVVEIVAMPELPPSAGAALKAQRGACTKPNGSVIVQAAVTILYALQSGHNVVLLYCFTPAGGPLPHPPPNHPHTCMHTYPGCRPNPM
jgi:hypothetical protein